MNDFNNLNETPENQTPRSSVYDDLMGTSSNNNGNNNINFSNNSSNNKEGLSPTSITIRLLLGFLGISFILSYIEKLIPTGLTGSFYVNVIISTIVTSIFRFASWKASMYITFGKRSINRSDVLIVAKNLLIVMLIIIILTTIIGSMVMKKTIDEIGSGFDIIREFYDEIPQDMIERNESLSEKYNSDTKYKLFLVFIIPTVVQAIADMAIVYYQRKELERHIGD